MAEETPRPIPEIIPETPAWLCEHHRQAARQEPRRPLPVGPGSGRRARRLRGPAQGARQDQEISPASRAASRGVRARWKWVAAAAVLLLPVIALAATEFAGVTHLFRAAGDDRPVNRGEPSRATKPAYRNPTTGSTVQREGPDRVEDAADSRLLARRSRRHSGRGEHESACSAPWRVGFPACGRSHLNASVDCRHWSGQRPSSSSDRVPAGYGSDCMDGDVRRLQTGYWNQGHAGRSSR